MAILLSEIAREVILLAEPLHEEPIQEPAEFQEREKQILNAETKLQWEINSRKHGRNWDSLRRSTMGITQSKIVSALLFEHQTEGQRIPTEKFSHEDIFDLSTKKMFNT